ncbi:MAG TPA: glycoside hydrolase family 172 protein [Gemmatimonadaceae bacterium]|nr:glycoside hydrolase family 172 protein [Gemmatimonadaceae bacterium]
MTLDACRRPLAAMLATLALPCAAGAQELFQMPPAGVESRWASPENPTGAKGRGGTAAGGRKGAPTIAIRAGASAVLAEARGTSGTVRRIWMTFGDRSPRMLRSLRLDIYWDGAATPAVSAPLGDFFGIGLGRTAVFESAFFSNPEGRSFNSIVPMPFRTGMRIVLSNESAADLPELFYDVDYTVGDAHPAGTLYFHAHWRRERETRLRADFEILPRVAGRGRYLGANIGVTVDGARYFDTWWGEGEVKVYLDGDVALPTLVGTGTEDYVGTAWGQGAFAHRYQGSPIADERAKQWAFYRYHVPDPIWFRRDARVTIQQIGYLADHSRGPFVRTGRTLMRAGAGEVPMNLAQDGKFERSDDWSSCAYFYLDRPENGLPPLVSVAERVAGM